MKMKKQLLLAAALVLSTAVKMSACTDFIAGKGATTDGSVLCTYNADDYGMFTKLCHYAAGKHAKGAMREIIDYDTHESHGFIPEASVTYNVIGNINEWQLCIGESTYGGRDEMVNKQGQIDYGSLMYLGLQRAKTAREAIKVMTQLVEKYGYISGGESFTICDPNEAWIMEMQGCGDDPKQKVVWCAVRIPDNALSGHANQSRIGLVSSYDTDVICSKNMISFARQKGWFTGKDNEFNWKMAYAKPDFSGRRICDARVWSFFRRFDKGMDRYLPWALGKDPNAEDMPLWIIPDHKISPLEMMACMRDHYEGTPLAMDNDLGQGLWDSPYRPTPLYYKVDGKQYFNERPTSTQQTGFSLCGTDALLAPARGGRHPVVWQRRRQHGGLRAYLLWQHRAARVLQHARRRRRDLLRQKRLLGVQLGEQHGLSALLDDVPGPQGCPRLAGEQLFRPSEGGREQGRGTLQHGQAGRARLPQPLLQPEGCRDDPALAPVGHLPHRQVQRHGREAREGRSVPPHQDGSWRPRGASRI